MAATSVITIDPDGDLILLLGPVPFESSIEETQSDNATTSIFGDAITLTNREEVESTDDFNPKPTQQYQLHLLCSSKHMSLASPVFKAMLTGSFQEAVKLREEGRTDIPLPGDDSDAMVTLVNIIHGRFKSIPEQYNLSDLTQIAILVDKYQCHESIHPFKHAWTDHLHADTWGNANFHALACWISVTWVFELNSKFKTATEKLIRESDAEIEVIMNDQVDFDLPTPVEIIEKLSIERNAAIEKLIRILSHTISRYQDSALRCSTSVDTFATMTRRSAIDLGPLTSHQEFCDSVTLGSLIRSATRQGLVELLHLPAEICLGFNDIRDKMKKLEVINGCDKLRGSVWGSHPVLTIILLSVEAVDKKLSGLDLADFTKTFDRR
ncbi:hypothetical protein EAE96_008677 [Botrytis aclada]|nr:hypothetical protein EAE96_008677 [Botrytis aclada]